MARKETKLMTVTLQLRVPVSMDRATVCREVRTLVNEQCNYAADPDDIRVVKASGKGVFA